MKFLNKTFSLCCAALLFAAGCTNTAETNGTNKQEAITEQDSATTETDTTAAKKKNEQCHRGEAEEKLELCATYQKNTADDGYTIHARVEVPEGSSFKIWDDGFRQDSMHRVIVIEYRKDKGANTTTYSDSVVVTNQQVQTDKETHIRVELHEEGAMRTGKDKDDKDLKRRVLIARAAK